MRQYEILLQVLEEKYFNSQWKVLRAGYINVNRIKDYGYGEFQVL